MNAENENQNDFGDRAATSLETPSPYQDRNPDTTGESKANERSSLSPSAPTDGPSRPAPKTARKRKPPAREQFLLAAEGFLRQANNVVAIFADAEWVELRQDERHREAAKMCARVFAQNAREYLQEAQAAFADCQEKSA